MFLSIGILQRLYAFLVSYIDIIFLFLDLSLFLLSFVYLIRDVKSYEGEETSEFKSNVLPKHSQYALMFGLLALVLAVVNSLWYV